MNASVEGAAEAGRRSTAVPVATATPEAVPDVTVPAQRSAPAVETRVAAAAPSVRAAPVAGPAARRTPPVVPVVDATAARPCRCGHDADVHEHFRSGTDCAACDCGRFRTTRGLRGAIAFTRRRR